jgi:hypothetical protein
MTNQALTKSVALYNCYECRDILKAHGGKFDSAAKCWILTKEQFDAVDAEIESLRGYSGKAKVAIVKSWDKAEGRWFEAPKSAAQLNREINEHLAKSEIDEKIQKVRMGVLSVDDAMNTDD